MDYTDYHVCYVRTNLNAYYNMIEEWFEAQNGEFCSFNYQNYHAEKIEKNHWSSIAFVLDDEEPNEYEY